MDVVLDTNIFYSDFSMKSKDFVIVFDYVKKTDSKIIVPKIVYEEIKARYKCSISNELKTLEKAKSSLERKLIEGLPEVKIDVEHELKKYITFFKETLNISEDEIVDYKTNYLDEVVNRAIWRIKPCSQKGEEFRDALLWLTVKDIALSRSEKAVIFISNNAKEFSSIDKKELHPDLFKETSKKGLTIKYHKTIKDFIKDHAIKIDFITSEWLISAIPLEEINEEVMNYFEQHIYIQENIQDWIEDKVEKIIGSYINILYADVALDDFYIYEMKDGSFNVTVYYSGEIEVECEIEKEDLDDGYLSPYKAKVFNFLILVTIGIIIKDKKVQEYEIEEVARG